jgi:acyl dehydratase
MQSMQSTASTTGPWFEDLAVGDVIRDAPPLTITDGHAALHQAILGDRLRLCLDAPLARRVLGRDAVPAHPGLVCDVAIGQSTLFTRRVRANLFYRGLALHRLVVIGDTLRTTTGVVALRENTRRPGRAPTGLAVLRITTVDQEDRPVLDFLRCAMLPLRDGSAATGHAADVAAVTLDRPAPSPADVLAGVDLGAFRAALPHGRHFGAVSAGDTWEVQGGDIVSCAPELARLTLNVAIAHHDAAAAGGTRLVYGGHTIGLAASQITRVLPELVTIVGWQGCDHTGPVHEGDTLHSVVSVTGTEPLPGGGGLVALRSIVRATRPDGAVDDVLDWRLTGVLA